MFMHWGRTDGQGADGAGGLLDTGTGELPLVETGTLAGGAGALLGGVTGTVAVLV